MRGFFLSGGQRRPMAGLIVLAVIFFFIYSYSSFFYLGQSPKFTSPDETVNYYFARLYAEKSELGLYEPLNPAIGGSIYPRNTYVEGDYIVPGSFLGLPFYYGLIGKIFGPGIILFITPLLAVLGVIFFYKLIKKIFSEKIAFLSALFMFIQPVYWFYSAKGMWHNVPFLSLLIIGFYFLSRLGEKKLADYILAGLFVALALAFRTAEIIWLVPIFLILMIFYWRIISKKYILLGILAGLIIFLPILYYQKLIFGGYFSLGYSRETISGEGLGLAFSNLSGKFANIFEYFGLKTENVWSNFYNYSLYLLFFIFSGTIFGFFISLKKIFKMSFDKRKILYPILFFISSFFLILFYGSYSFKEFLDQSAIVFGSSYLRYWLPVYIFGLPYLIVFIFWLKEKFSRKLRYFWLTIVVIIIYSSFQLVVFDPYYGLVKTRTKDLASFEIILNEVIRETEPEAVILAGPDDKIIFPERRVVAYNFNDLPAWKEESLPKIWAEGYPIYYLSQIPAELEQINEFLKKENLNFEFIKEIDSVRKLYKLTAANP